jgi:hypothetical protein
MSNITNKLQQKPTEYQEQLNQIDHITRQWAILSQFEKDLENYSELKEHNDSL